MLKILALQKKRTSLQAQLKSLRAKRKQLRADETALQQKVEELEEITPELEQQIDQLTEQQTQTDDEIADVQDQLDDVETQIADLQDKIGGEPPADRSAGKHPAQRNTPAASRFNCRSRCFGAREERDAFYAQSEVKDFIGRVRSMCSMAAASNRRSVTGADLSIPTQILDVLRDNLEQYSKIINCVRKRSVRGKSRQNVIGDIPEGVWMEMSGALNDLEFILSDIEVDGYKVGGVIIIDNYLLEDSDVALGEEILYMLGQSIGYAVDKGIVYGKGPSSKMPVGIVTRLAQTEQPGYWGANQGEWTDLHGSNILKLNLANANGAEFFTPLLQALRKAKKKKMSGDRVWLMNEATKDDLLIRALGFDASAAIVSGMKDTMPILGGEIITLDFIPDNEIVGGYLIMYLLAEREGGQFGYSDLPLYIQDKTVFKGTARYDGQPVFGECFVAVSYDNTEVTTEMKFASDYANTDLNALVVTSAAGTKAGQTVLTVSGAVSAANTLKACVSGSPVKVEKGMAPDESWKDIVSGTTVLAAAGGVGITVVELDEKGKVISVGYLAAATSAAG